MKSSVFLIFLPIFLLSACGQSPTQPVTKPWNTEIPIQLTESGTTSYGMETAQVLTQKTSNHLQNTVSQSAVIMQQTKPEIAEAVHQTIWTLVSIAQTTWIPKDVIQSIIVAQGKPLWEYQKILLPYRILIQEQQKKNPKLKISEIPGLPVEVQSQVKSYEEIFENTPQNTLLMTNNGVPSTIVANTMTQSIAQTIGAIVIATPDIAKLSENIQAIEPYTLQDGSLVSKEFKENFENYKKNMEFTSSENRDESLALQSYIILLDQENARIAGRCNEIRNESSRLYCEFQKTNRSK